MDLTAQEWDYAQITATGNVYGAQGFLGGIFVSNAAAAPTITIYDSATTTTAAPIITVFTPVSATWYPLPFKFQNGLYIVIANTVSATVAYLRGFPFNKA